MITDIKFSVICPLYNHEKYVLKTINSILAQTYTNFEVIIIDDCSTDNSYNVAKEINDSRVTIFKNNFNMGISNTLNNGIKKATGDWICILATDDMLREDHLSKVLECIFYSKNLSAVYSGYIAIDEFDNNINQDYYIPTDKNNIIYDAYFSLFNELPAPGSCIKNNIFKEIGFFNPGLIQTQDFDFNLKILLNYNIGINNNSTVFYRRFSDNRNISSSKNNQANIMYYESKYLLDNFILYKNNNIYHILTDLNTYENETEYIYNLLLSAIKSDNRLVLNWAFNNLIALLNNENNFEYLNKKYNFIFKDYLYLYNVFNRDISKNNKNILYLLKRKIKKIIKD